MRLGLALFFACASALAQVPQDLAFREGSLASFLGRRPIVLVLGYEGCVNLCGTTLASASQALRAAGLAADRDYTALFVSIDPRDERAPPMKRDGWHFLTGAAAAAALARAVGFQYQYEKQSGEFSHPAGFFVLTPQGTVARSFDGVVFDPQELRTSLARAATGETQSGFQRLWLRCFHDPVSGRYTPVVLMALRIAMGAFLILLGFVAWRKLA